MTETATRTSIANLTDLKEFVFASLCSENDLICGEFPTMSAPIYRAGALCGIMFCVSGPRATEFTAVWENDKNRVFYYGPTGERTRTVNLSGRVALE